MKVKVAKWGDGLGLKLPKDAAESAGLKAGTEVDLVLEGQRLRVNPLVRTKTSRELLDEMVAEMKRLGPEAEPETVDWGPDRGSEILSDDDPR
jgi:antitoxin MazE